MTIRTPIQGLVFAAVRGAAVYLAAQTPTTTHAPAPAITSAKTIGLNQPVPIDPQDHHRQAAERPRYYVKKNRKPEKRAELRLVVNAGSVLEDDDQRGLAHFVEHMAFNGTSTSAPADHRRTWSRSACSSARASTRTRASTRRSTAPDSDRPARLHGQGHADPRGLGARRGRSIRRVIDKERRRRHRGMAARPRRRGAAAATSSSRCCSPARATRIGCRSASTDIHREVRARTAEEVLQGLVPPGPDGRDRGRRLRQGRRSSRCQAAVRVHQESAQSAAAPDVQRARSRGHALHDRHRQGSDVDERARLRQAARARSGERSARTGSRSSRRCTTACCRLATRRSPRSRTRRSSRPARATASSCAHAKRRRSRRSSRKTASKRASPPCSPRPTASRGSASPPPS